jgi:hypothetical protein
MLTRLCRLAYDKSIFGFSQRQIVRTPLFFRRFPMTRKSLSEDRMRSLEKEVIKTLDISKNCAQTSFSVLEKEFDLDGGEILKALTPFPGLGLRGETCGAVAGCLMALGLVFGREDLADWKGYTACADLLEAKMGRRYDLADRWESVKYAANGGKKTCGKIISSAVLISAELIDAKTA